MGCDIHLYVEKRENGKWVHAQNHLLVGDDQVPDVPYEQKIYSGRNYSLFAILAGVRNGIGFAGCDTGDGFKPICEPKGYPCDVSPEIAAIAASWGQDAHSASWHTLADLLAYDWTQITVVRGVIDAVTAFKWFGYNEKRGESPDSWYDDVGGSSVIHISVDEMREKIDAIKPLTKKESYQATLTAIKSHLKDTYCRAEWRQPYYETVRFFLSDAIPQLLRLGKPEDVRIVFWFDN